MLSDKIYLQDKQEQQQTEKCTLVQLLPVCKHTHTPPNIFPHGNTQKVSIKANDTWFEHAKIKRMQEGTMGNNKLSKLWPKAWQQQK